VAMVGNLGTTAKLPVRGGASRIAWNPDVETTMECGIGANEGEIVHHLASIGSARPAVKSVSLCGRVGLKGGSRWAWRAALRTKEDALQRPSAFRAGPRRDCSFPTFSNSGTGAKMDDGWTIM